MKLNVLDSGSAYAPVWSQDDSIFVQFLIARPNHKCNRYNLRCDAREDFYCGLLERGTIIVQDIYFRPQIDEIKVFLLVIKKYFRSSMCKIENIEKEKLQR